MKGELSLKSELRIADITQAVGALSMWMRNIINR
jgi:hypothetical protein